MGKTVDVCGWVRTSRDSKNVAFIELNDGTSLKHLQIVLDKSKFESVAKFLSLGSALKVTGLCVQSQNNSELAELNALDIQVLGECPAEYPIQKKPHSLEFLRTMPHLRMRTNTFNAVFRMRSKLAQALHSYFWQNGYMYVQAPIITGSDCEGAGEAFKVTTHGFDHKCKTEEEYNATDFFGTPATLSVSGQLEGEAYATALGKIYTFGPSFRAENSQTTRHVAEFWHIEPEVAFADIHDIIEVAESMLKYVIKFCLDNCKDEMEFFEKHYEKGLKEKLTAVLNSKFEKLDYTKAIEILQKSGKKFEHKVEWGGDLATEHERYIAEEVFNKPVFVINYPKELKSFYMKQNPDGKTMAAADLLCPGIGEVIGGSERETDYNKIATLMNERKMKISDYTNYLELRKFGSVPHSGFGLGFERLLMYISGMSNIRDVQGYPRASKELRV